MKKTILILWVFWSGLAMSAEAKTYTLISSESNKTTEDNGISNRDFDFRSDHEWSVNLKTLHGGKQEGVRVIEVDNGVLSFSVIPTRGMSIFKVKSGDVELGWHSPIKEIVHPKFIDLESRGGLGWLDGFNEWMVRCGYAFAGHPGEDGDWFLTLHGKAGNIPASEVEVIVEPKPPHRIRIRGRVDEKTFKFANFEMWTEISTEIGSTDFQISDTLKNNGSYEKEFQIIYHGNYGPPLLEKGAEFVGPVKKVMPFDEYAAKDLGTWTTYLGPTPKYGEQVYCLELHADDQGQTTVMLHNQAGDKGVAMSYPVAQLPYFTLWKNTDTVEEGYVTGLEPATGYPYNRSIEREQGRVPKLQPGESRSFTIDFSILGGRKAVDGTKALIEGIQKKRETVVDKNPPK